MPTFLQNPVLWSPACTTNNTATLIFTDVTTYIQYSLIILQHLLAAMSLYTRPRIVVVVVWVGVNHFIFTRKRLGGISSYFAYTFIVLLINFSQSVN